MNVLPQELEPESFRYAREMPQSFFPENSENDCAIKSSRLPWRLLRRTYM